MFVPVEKHDYVLEVLQRHGVLFRQSDFLSVVPCLLEENIPAQMVVRKWVETCNAQMLTSAPELLVWVGRCWRLKFVPLGFVEQVLVKVGVVGNVPVQAASVLSSSLQLMEMSSSEVLSVWRNGVVLKQSSEVGS